MAAWVLTGHRKLNLDRAAWIDRSSDGAVHVVFDGALNHTFHGPAAEAVWKLITARDVETVTVRSAAKTSPRPRRRSGKA